MNTFSSVRPGEFMRRLGGILLLTFSYLAGCADASMAVRAGKSGSADADGDLIQEDIRGGSKGDPFAIFKERVHPLLEENCSNCHATTVAPNFAVSDAQKSHDVLLESKKVNMQKPESSRIVARLGTDSHNCWGDCAENAQEMLEAVKAWVAASKQSGAPAFELQTEEIPLSKAERRDRNPGTIVVEGEDLEGARDEEEAGRKFASITQANAALDVSITVKEAGAYRVWFEVKGPATPWNVNASGGLAGSGTLAASEDWSYVPLMNGVSLAVVNLPIGKVNLTFASSAATDLKIDRIVLTNAQIAAPADFRSADHVPDEVMTFSFSLDGLLGGSSAELLLDAQRLGLEALKVSNLRLETQSDTIHIAGVNILVNGLLDERYATFRIVDATVEPPGDTLSTATTTVLVDPGVEDPTLSFGFETLKAK